VRDPYDILAVKRDAKADDIKRAYRKLAKAYHPDRNANDPKAKDRFAEINAAYEILGAEDKRKAFDRGEIDAEGKQRFRPQEGFGAGRGGAHGFEFDLGGFGAGPFGRTAGAKIDPSELFGDLFRKFEKGPGDPYAKARAPERPDIAMDLPVTLEEVAAGGAKRVALPGGRAVEVNLPKGVGEGKVIRLAGQGRPDPLGIGTGDVLLTVRYAPHPQFRLDGRDLSVRVPVALADAVLGGTIRVPTLSGAVEMRIPAGSGGGKTFRLRGKGLPQDGGAGDLLAVVDIVLPEGDSELEALLRRQRG